MDELEARFYQLSPAELATLWLANDVEQVNDSKPTILASSTTLVLMIVLAEGYGRIRSDSIAEKALTEIAKYSKELVSHLAERGSYVRYDLPVRKLIERLEEIGFPILPEKTYETLGESGKKKSASSLSYEYASELYKATLNSLEASNLLIDPPWYRNPLAIGSLIVLLGSVPLEINVKTIDGQKVVTSIEKLY